MDNQIPIPAGLPEEKQQASKRATELMANAMKIVVQNASEASIATDILRSIKDQYNTLEAKRKEFTGPILAAKQNIDAEFKKMQEPFAKAEQIIKAKLVAFQREQERIAAEERRKAEEERQRQIKEAEEKGEQVQPQLAPTPQIEPQNTIKTESGAKASFRTVTRFEVQDEGKVPRMFLSVDEKKIRQGIADGIKEIPGVRIYEDKTVAV